MKGQISVPHILFKPDCKLNTLSSILTSERRGDIHIDQRLHYCHSSASSPFIIPALTDLTHGSHTHTKNTFVGLALRLDTYLPLLFLLNRGQPSPLCVKAFLLIALLCHRRTGSFLTHLQWRPPPPWSVWPT